MKVILGAKYEFEFDESMAEYIYINLDKFPEFVSATYKATSADRKPQYFIDECDLAMDIPEDQANDFWKSVRTNKDLIAIAETDKNYRVLDIPDNVSDWQVDVEYDSLVCCESIIYVLDGKIHFAR